MTAVLVVISAIGLFFVLIATFALLHISGQLKRIIDELFENRSGRMMDVFRYVRKGSSIV